MHGPIAAMRPRGGYTQRQCTPYCPALGQHPIHRINLGGPDIGAHHVERHLTLEFELTQRLLASNRESRWQIFYDCYTTLYRELPWLNKTPEEADETVRPSLLLWRSLLGQHARIFEVGSGQARLLKYLVDIGHSCVATEITPERGSKHLDKGDGLVWHTTDGIHLAEFEETHSFDL